jgi:hypothetical protein
MGNEENKIIQFKLNDIGRVMFLLNNLNIKGMDQASALVEIAHILDSGKVIDSDEAVKTETIVSSH